MAGSVQPSHADSSNDVLDQLADIQRAWQAHLAGGSYAAEFTSPSPDRVVQGTVEDAIRQYDSEGMGAFATINAIESEGAYYPFVLDADTLDVVAEGAFPVVVGLPAIFLDDADRTSEAILADLDADGGTWAEYLFLNPATGTEQLKRAWLSLHDGYIFGAGHYLPVDVDDSTPESRTLSVLEEAIHLYESEREDAFAAINAAATDDPQLLTIYDIVTGEIVADGTSPARVGQSLSTFFQVVPSDVIYERVIDRTGLWKEYTESDPATGTDRRVYALSVVHEDGYVFEAGYVYAPAADVQREVEEAIRLYDADPETAFDRITWQSVKTALIYPFVLDGTNFATLAHAVLPDLVGVCCSDAIRETGDKSFEQIMDEIQDGPGTWVVYSFTHPVTKADQTKRTWLSLHDGHVFGSGYYPTEYDIAKDTVAESIRMYDERGTDAFDAINTMESADLIYPFVLDADTLDVVAEGAFPDVVGLPAVFLNDIDLPLEQVLADLETGDGLWVEYPFLNPDTNTQQLKRAWLSMHDGYIFGSGYYQSPAIEAQSLVRDIVQLYDVNPEAALASVTSGQGTDFNTPYVLDYDTLDVVAHGEDPNGLAPFLSDGLRTSWTGSVLADRLQDEESLWLNYEIMPDGGETSYVRSWLQLHDGHVFGARYDVTPAEMTRFMIVDTLYLYDLHGEGLFPFINNIVPADPWPDPFILDTTTNRYVASAAFPEFIGTFIPLEFLFDRPPEVVFADILANDGIWIDTAIFDPVTAGPLLSRVFMNLHDDYLFVIFYDEYPAEVAQRQVEEAIRLYDADPETAFDRITWQSARVSSVYPFVLNASDWSTVAHGALPWFVGLCCSDDIRDTGDKSFEQLMEEMESNPGAWVEYTFYNPVVGIDQPKQPKRTWLSLHDGYIFGAGYYYIEAEIAVGAVNEAVSFYDIVGEDLFAEINSMMSTSPYYPFVLDATTLDIVAHGADPSWVGKNFLEKTGGAGLFDSAERIASAPGQAMWSDLYPALNPDTGVVGIKDSWLQLHDGYIFGAGYYAFAGTDE